MKHHDLDDIFRQGLDKSVYPDHRELQWKIVSERLHQKNKTNSVWMLVALGLIVILTVLLPVFKPSTTNHEISRTEPTNQTISTSNKSFVDDKNLRSSKEVSTEKVLVQKDNKFTKEDLGVPITRSNQTNHLDESSKDITKAGTSNHYSSNLVKDNTSIHNKAHPILTKDDVIIKPKSLKQIKIMQLSSPSPRLLEFPDPHLDLPESKVGVVKNTTNKRSLFYLRAGYARVWIPDASVSDSTHISPYLGVQFALTKRMRLSIDYTKRDIRRKVEDQYTYYNIPVIEPYQLNDLVFTELAYSSTNIDLFVSYDYLQLDKWDVSFHFGTQISNNREISNSHFLTNVYGSDTIVSKLSDTGYYVSDLTFGLGTRILLYKGLGIDAHYQYYLPISSASFQWKRKSKLQAGLFFSF